MSEDIRLTDREVYSFSELILSQGYDMRKATPDFHRRMWELATDESPQVALAAPRNHAKAQALESRVLTPAGWATIGTLRVGDWVIGGEGKRVRVTQLHPISEMELYRVTTQDRKSALCNLEHLWNVVSDQPGVQVLSLKAILKNWRTGRGKYVEYRYYIPAVKPIAFSPGKFEIDPYTLGAWLGAGHCAGSRFTIADPELLKYFPYKTEKQPAKCGYVIREIHSGLKALKLINNKHIPEKYFRGSVAQRLALLRGLMDTDGTCHQEGKIAWFGSTNKQLVDGVVSLVRGLGGVAHESHGKTACNGEPFWSWRVSVRLPEKINPFRLRRKAKRWVGGETNAKIVSIEKEKTGLGRCISVEGGTYVTDDYLVTHNSTSITHAYLLACLCFRQRRYVIIVSDTEEQAVEFLTDIKNEIRDNDKIRDLIGFKKFVKDATTDVIVETKDLYQFRILAKGAEQKLRGRKWRGRRPDLIIGDDLENDEVVENADRREKFRRWFFAACKQSLSDDGIIRIVGTILHEDSLLNRLLKNKTWLSQRFQAHKSFEDFSEILWEEKFPVERLKAIRQEFIEEGVSELYSQEYLNDPFDNSANFFKRPDFINTPQDKRDELLLYYAGGDLAISKADRAAYTAFKVVGVNAQGMKRVVYSIKGRWDSLEILDHIFEISKKFYLELFFLEAEKVQKSIGPFLYEEMRRQNHFINIETIVPTKDKRTRARPLQKEMRAGGVTFDMDAEWFPGVQQEMLRFDKGVNDDDVDSLGLIFLGLESMVYAPSEEERQEEDYWGEYEETSDYSGRDEISGY